MTAGSEVPVSARIIGRRHSTATKPEKAHHTKAKKLQYFMPLYTPSILPAPKFWLAKVDDASAIVPSGSMKMSSIFRAAVCAVMVLVPNELTAPCKITEPTETIAYISPIDIPVVARAE